MKIPKLNAFIIKSYFRSLSTNSGKGNAKKNIVIMDLKTIQTHLDRLEVKFWILYIISLYLLLLDIDTNNPLWCSCSGYISYTIY